MATRLELARAFASAWSPRAEVSDEVAVSLVALCAAARRELPELDDAIDDGTLVAALAARAPESDVVAYLERSTMRFVVCPRMNFGSQYRCSVSSHDHGPNVTTQPP